MTPPPMWRRLSGELVTTAAVMLRPKGGMPMFLEPRAAAGKRAA
jgi:hypothetical protein